ncbi:MAG: FHA domain-containing protein [Bacteriovoracaceae bacterium]|nr:FHA domain-containing protein [Bacteriovoracaceae bacterium]
MKLIVLKNNVPLDEVSVETTDLHEMYEIYVGRSEDCHVRIDDPLISRHHFVLKNEKANWYCEKISQLGVVTLNGSLVSKNPVHNGDEVKCGAYSIIITGLTSLAPSPQVTMPELTNIIAPVVEPLPAKEIIRAPVQEARDENQELNESMDSFESMEQSSLDSDSESVGESIDFSDDLGSNNESAELTEDFGGEMVASEGFGEEGSSSDDQFGLSAIEPEESTRFFKAFVNYQLVLFGEHAPYDRFQVDQEEIYIGRDTKKCQIILNDPEVSSVHAVIKKNNIEITLEDLNSSNGTILNGERINKATITAGDEFVIGSTSFTLEVRSDLLESESDRLMPVESGQTIETEEIEEEEISLDENGDINFDSDAPPEKSIIKRIWKNPAQRKKAIYIGAALVLGYVFLAPPEEEAAPKPKVVKEAAKVEDKGKIALSPELQNRRNQAYELGVSFFEQNKYFEALNQFQTVMEIDKEYKKIQTYFEQTKIALKRLDELEEQKRAEEDRIKTKKLIEELMVKAREAVKERNVPVAESYFAQITEKDPENIEVQQLKFELESWQKEEERKTLERAAKEAARKKLVDSLAPGKTFYLKREWYRAILKLEEFLRLKGADEDLVKEASDMLSDSRNQLASELGPLLGKARSLKEGQDLKSAYETFLEILKIEPTNSEALNEVDDIKNQLDSRSKRIYREAIIAESLSLFGDAKEKFQEVQQISPTDSEYYKKASEKLRNYLE